MTTYEVVDRGEGQAPSLRRFSAVNPRYDIRCVETHEVVDSLTSKKAATATARHYTRNGLVP
jgi:hypothetical protein